MPYRREFPATTGTFEVEQGMILPANLLLVWVTSTALSRQSPALAHTSKSHAECSRVCYYPARRDVRQSPLRVFRRHWLCVSTAQLTRPRWPHCFSRQGLYTRTCRETDLDASPTSGRGGTFVVSPLVQRCPRGLSPRRARG